MSTKFQVTKTGAHEFKSGEVVVLQSRECAEYKFFAGMAAVLGMTSDPRFPVSEAYRSTVTGAVQILQSDEVAPLD